MAKGFKTGGRVAGVPNKATADIKALAQEYTPAAIRRLAALAGLLEGEEGKAQSEPAQVSALRELIERGHGKASQTIDMNVSDRRQADLSLLSDKELAALRKIGEKVRAGLSAAEAVAETRH